MLELILHDSKIMPQECEQIASSELVCELKTLDLSCNPIGLTGLFSLFHNLNLPEIQVSQLDLKDRLKIHPKVPHQPIVSHPYNQLIGQAT